MNTILQVLKQQSIQLEKLFNKGEHLQKKLEKAESQNVADNSSLLREYSNWHMRVLTAFCPLLKETENNNILEK